MKNNKDSNLTNQRRQDQSDFLTNLGERIKFARELQGYSQTAFASKIKMSQGTLAKVEMGLQKNISEDSFNCLTEITGFHKDWFFKSFGYNRGGDFRAYSTLKKEIKVKFEREAQFKLYSIRDKIKVCSGIDYNVDFSFLDSDNFNENDSPQDRANKLREFWGIPINSPIRDLFTIVQNRGIFLFPHTFDKIDGIYYMNEDPDGDLSLVGIWLNLNTSLARNTFTLAHELGHLTNHHFSLRRKNSLLKDSIFDSDGIALPEKSVSLVMESEANSFAQELLMPEMVIKGLLSERLRLDDYLDLKNRFHVSAKALIRRAYDLKRITEKRYKSLCIQMSQKGWNNQEPNDEKMFLNQNKFFLEKRLDDIYRQTFAGFAKEDLFSFLSIDSSSPSSNLVFNERKNLIPSHLTLVDNNLQIKFVKEVK